MSLTAQQLAVRRLGIGSSDVAALVGLDPHRTRFDVFNEKFFGAQKKLNDEMGWGNFAEPGIIGFRAAQLGAALLDDEEFKGFFGGRILSGRTVRSKESSLALSTTDAILTGVPESVGYLIIEAKNVGAFAAGEWGDDDDAVPRGYFLQCQWHQGVTGIDRCELVASVAGAPPAPWTIGPRPDLFGNLLEVAERFWTDHVLTGKPPSEIDGSEAASEYLRLRFPKESQALLQRATPAMEAAALGYAAATAAEKAAAEWKETARNHLCGLIGDTEGFVLADGRRATWKWQPNGKKAPTRVLRVSELKEKKR